MQISFRAIVPELRRTGLLILYASNDAVSDGGEAKSKSKLRVTATLA